MYFALYRSLLLDTHFAAIGGIFGMGRRLTYAFCLGGDLSMTAWDGPDMNNGEHIVTPVELAAVKAKRRS